MHDDLTPNQQQALASLKASRGSCPSAETLLEYESLDAAARARHPAHDHVAICSRCQLILLHAAAPDSAQTRETWRAVARQRVGGWLLPLAAIAILAVGATLFLPTFRSNVPPETVRGTEIVATAPIGSTPSVPEFAWQSPIVAAKYRVTVRRGTAVVWQAETTESRAGAPPPGTIERDVQYDWLVEALDREGHVRMTSPPQSFILR